ncbi:hypothetical protein N0V88_004356 [Collariella sp. IMI 366227]|nr:hypothetical protein N0V88_004356 [Collariella sp. IMI 366227]
MPITDLLASIEGVAPTPSPKPLPRPTAILPKRKAEDELRSTSTKAPRIDRMPDKPSSANDNMPKLASRPADRPLDTSFKRSSSAPRPLPSKTTPNGKPNSAAPKLGTSAGGSKTLASRPLVTRPAAADSAPAKKRSFAEIMARAKASTMQRESLGKIQHKTVERPLTMKERKEMREEEARKAKITTRKSASVRPGTTPGVSRNGSRTPVGRNGQSPAPADAKKKEPVEEKKVKKAALATTGYTGTARPRPGTTATAKAGAATRPGSDARPRDRSRFGGLLTSRRRREDEDEDLDDFIDDEMEEPQYGSRPRYEYDSAEDESDMEAGISDIEDEEQTAARYARREDLEQEALEKRLKREKEERKRKYLEAAKSKAGNR